jgi:hypothetical protein
MIDRVSKFKKKVDGIVNVNETLREEGSVTDATFVVKGRKLTDPIDLGLNGVSGTLGALGAGMVDGVASGALEAGSGALEVGVEEVKKSGVGVESLKSFGPAPDVVVEPKVVVEQVVESKAEVEQVVESKVVVEQAVEPKAGPELVVEPKAGPEQAVEPKVEPELAVKSKAVVEQAVEPKAEQAVPTGSQENVVDTVDVSSEGKEKTIKISKSVNERLPDLEIDDQSEMGEVIEIQQVLFEGFKAPASRIAPEKGKVVKNVVDYVFIANGISSINVSFFGSLFEEIETDEFTTVDILGTKFITMKHGTSLSNIYSFVSLLYSSMKEKSKFVCDFVKEVSVEGKKAYSLYVSIVDLQAISLCCPEYVFGLAGVGKEISNLKLVVTCQK